MNLLHYYDDVLILKPRTIVSDFTLITEYVSSQNKCTLF